ncbi:MAG TPA: hypothetical protein VJT10_12545 [Steroidobacteraceae bacterium]|jgi:hypothetical protein|nr:hypothetical protein [Steroidobacteraceae bacterium]
MLGAWLATGIAVAHAADTPARLREDEASIESKLHVPDGIEPGRYDVRCDLRVMENGKPRNIWCYAPDSAVPGKLVAAVLNATLRAKFVPATRDGKPAQVHMMLMVRTVITDDEPLVLVLPNDGVEHARLGLFYIAPQRFNLFAWNARYRLPHSPVRKLSDSAVYWQELSIDEHGKVTQAKLTNGSDAPLPEIAEQMRWLIDHMQFLPGFVDGKPVSMRYVEPFIAP